MQADFGARPAVAAVDALFYLPLVDSVEDGAGECMDDTQSQLPPEQWYDTTTVHAPAPPKAPKSWRSRANARLPAKTASICSPLGSWRRTRKYSPLAERQALHGLCATAPTIRPVAVSTHGEVCPSSACAAAAYLEVDQSAVRTYV